MNLVGTLEENRLAALLQTSDLILLPITTKRGSNLKTAEAIVSRKKFVATDNTFHGFEAYRNLPNIYVGNSQKDFKEAILKALLSDYVKPTQQETELAEKVKWEYCLQPIIPAIKRIFRPSYRAKAIKGLVASRRLIRRRARTVLNGLKFQ